MLHLFRFLHSLICLISIEVAEGFVCPDPSEVDQPGHYTRHAHPTDCRKFYVCIEGVARPYGCSFGNVFNVETLQCDDPESVAGCEKYYGDIDPKTAKKLKNRNWWRRHLKKASPWTCITISYFCFSCRLILSSVFSGMNYDHDTGLLLYCLPEEEEQWEWVMLLLFFHHHHCLFLMFFFFCFCHDTNFSIFVWHWPSSLFLHLVHLLLHPRKETVSQENTTHFPSKPLHSFNPYPSLVSLDTQHTHLDDEEDSRC